MGCRPVAYWKNPFIFLSAESYVCHFDGLEMKLITSTEIFPKTFFCFLRDVVGVCFSGFHTFAGYMDFSRVPEDNVFGKDTKQL